MTPLVEAGIRPFQGMKLNAKSSRKVADMVLGSAYVDVQLKQREEARAAWMERRAATTSKRKIEKEAAAISGSGSTPAPTPKAKADSEMSAEEADAALIKEFGDGHRDLRRMRGARGNR